MSLTKAEYVAALKEVLVLLRPYCWGRCVGCSGEGLAFDTLLAQLITLSSGFHWDATLLRAVLNKGRSWGTVVVYPQSFYWFNANMLFVNSINYEFTDIIPGLCEPHLHRHMPFVIY